jgi:hypothetical protein
LERDGDANVAIRAAASGVFDFTNCAIHDPAWRRRLRLVVRGIRLQDGIELTKARLGYYQASLASTRIDTDKTMTLAIEAFEDLQGKLRPWLGVTEEDRAKRAEENFRSNWEAIAGFSIDDELSLEEWESQLYDHLSEKEKENAEKGRQQEEMLANFHRRVEELKSRRKNPRNEKGRL